MAKDNKPEWDFDATTTVESNRRVPPQEGECLCCGHVHRGRATKRFRGEEPRCWALILLPTGRRRFCRCAVLRGLRKPSSNVIGPFWAWDYLGAYRHLWHYERGFSMAWSVCGHERDREQLDQERAAPRTCAYCRGSALATRASGPIESRPLSEGEEWVTPGSTVPGAQLTAWLADLDRKRQEIERLFRLADADRHQRDALLRDYLELLRQARRQFSWAQAEMSEQISCWTKEVLR